MADVPSYPDTRDDGDTGGPGRESPPVMPRWVWISAIAVGVLIVLAVVVMLVAGGQHGPARHTASGAPATSGATQAG